MGGRLMRRLRLSAALGLAAVVTGSMAASASSRQAPLAVTAGQILEVLVNQGSSERSVDLYLPPVTVPLASRSLAPKPLLLVLHAWHQSSGVARSMTGFDALADAGEVTVAYPHGLNGGHVGNESWNAGTCCGYATHHEVDDVGFLTLAVQAISNLTPIDRTRVFVVGWSNGAMMALRAVCDRPDVFRGAVSLSGTLLSPCEAGPAASALLVNGQRDTTVPYAGLRYSSFLQGPVVAVADSVRTLSARSVCRVRRHSVDSARSSDLYLGCADRSVIETVLLHDLGHEWPTLDNSGYDATKSAWQFLKALEAR